jgi:hypothetical protein
MLRPAYIRINGNRFIQRNDGMTRCAKWASRYIPGGCTSPSAHTLTMVAAGRVIRSSEKISSSYRLRAPSSIADTAADTSKNAIASVRGLGLRITSGPAIESEAYPKPLRASSLDAVIAADALD